jgi:hypothetical protein
MAAPVCLPRLAGMTRKPQTQRVEVSFVGAPPTQQIERASGVSEVEVDGSSLRCLVCGSFQPFLEALRGHEVVNLSASPVAARAPEDASDVTSEAGMDGLSTPRPTNKWR